MLLYLYIQLVKRKFNKKSILKLATYEWHTIYVIEGIAETKLKSLYNL